MSPRLVLLALVAVAFLAASAIPYKLESDTAFQLKSLQQWLAGDSPNPGTLRLPDPEDLSRDSYVWSNWWPPAFPFLYAPLAATGLPFGVSLRVTSLLLFLAGGLGWLRLAERLEIGKGVLLLFTVSLAAYALTLGGLASLRSTDLLSFAVAPWLFALVLKEEGSGASRLLLLGIALGATYWLRYSLFLTVLPLFLWLALREGLDSSHNLRSRAGRLAALGAGFALPVVLLLALNLSQSANTGETVSGSRSALKVEKEPAAGPLRLTLSLAGAPGLALFQNDLWMTHLTYFSDARLPPLRDLEPADRRAVKSLLALPATLALLWGLAREWRRRRRSVILLAAAMTGFYLALMALSALYHFDYLANEPRLASGFMPLAQLLALSGWLTGGWPATWREQIRTAMVLALFFALPLAFTTMSFLKNDVYDRLRPPYIPSSTGLFVKELSDRNVPEVTAAIRAASRSPEDLLMLVSPPGESCAYVPWLELQQRALPMGPLCGEMGGRYYETANLRATRPLVSTRPLRIVLVLPEGPEGEAVRRQLAARIPQARQWRGTPVPDPAHVMIWYSDLEVP